MFTPILGPIPTAGTMAATAVATMADTLAAVTMVDTLAAVIMADTLAAVIADTPADITADPAMAALATGSRGAIATGSIGAAKTPAAAGIRPQTTQSISGTAMRHTARDLLGDTRLDTVSTLVMAGIDCANYSKETASNSTRFGRLG